jgi:hypothetical protein
MISKVVGYFFEIEVISLASTSNITFLYLDYSTKPSKKKLKVTGGLFVEWIDE